MTGHLIHIGYAKTGSNFLRMWFSSHPQLGYVNGGLAGARSVHEIVRQATKPTNVLYRVTSSEELSTPHWNTGGAIVDWQAISRSNMQSTQEAVCKILAATFPNAHILLVTRGYRSFIVSAYSQYIRMAGTEDFATFTGHIAQCAQGDQAFGNYDHLTQLYAKYFPGSLIALPYELLRDNPESFIDELERRLGLEHHPAPAEAVNASFSSVELAWYPKFSRLAQRISMPNFLGRKLMSGYLRAIQGNRLRHAIRFLQTYRPQPPITGEDVPDAILNQLRGQAESLRELAVYAPYSRDYLWESPVRT